MFLYPHVGSTAELSTITAGSMPSSSGAVMSNNGNIKVVTAGGGELHKQNISLFSNLLAPTNTSDAMKSKDDGSAGQFRRQGEVFLLSVYFRFDYCLCIMWVATTGTDKLTAIETTLLPEALLLCSHFPQITYYQ